MSAALFQGEQGFVLCFLFTHTNKLQLVLNILGTEYIFVPLFQGEQGFVLCFLFTHTNKLQLVLNILGTEYIFVPFTSLYINFKTGTYKLYPQ